MSQFQISYFAEENPEIITANNYVLNGEWYIFTDARGPVAQIRANLVHRVDRLAA